MMTTEPATASASNDKFKKYALYAVGGYLGACVLFALVIDKQAIRTNLLNKCGSDSQFCNCQADDVLSQMSFFKLPLITLKLMELAPSGPKCRVYLD